MDSGCVSTNGSQADTELGTCKTNLASKAITRKQHCGDSTQRVGLIASQNLPIHTLGHQG